MSNTDQNLRHVATISDYQQTFNTSCGQKVLRHLMKNCGIMQPSMDLKTCNSHATAFNEGRRAVIIEILQKLRLDLVKVEAEIRAIPEGESDVII